MFVSRGYGSHSGSRIHKAIFHIRSLREYKQDGVRWSSNRGGRTPLLGGVYSTVFVGSLFGGAHKKDCNLPNHDALCELPPLITRLFGGGHWITRPWGRIWIHSTEHLFLLAGSASSWQESTPAETRICLGIPSITSFPPLTLVGSWYQEKCVCRISYLITFIWPKGICRDSWKLNWITRCYHFLGLPGLVLGWQFVLVEEHPVHTKMLFIDLSRSSDGTCCICPKKVPLAICRLECSYLHFLK